MGNNGHSVKLRLKHGHITMAHIQAMLKKIFLNILAFISKTNLKQSGILYQDYQSLGPKQNFQDIVVTGTDYTKRCKFFMATFKRHGAI